MGPRLGLGPHGYRGRPGLVAELEALRARVSRTALPLSHAENLYDLRQHIDLVESRLRQPGP